MTFRNEFRVEFLVSASLAVLLSGCVGGAPAKVTPDGGAAGSGAGTGGASATGGTTGTGGATGTGGIASTGGTTGTGGAGGMTSAGGATGTGGLAGAGGATGTGGAAGAAGAGGAAGPVRVVALSGGGGHTCELLVDGTVQCWGSNSFGQLGNNSQTPSATPVAVRGLAGNATTVSAGSNFTCASLTGGTVQCWGYNSYGQLGIDSTTLVSLAPVTVTGLTGAIAVSAGAFHACALLTGGTVQCWGWNGNGALGSGSTTTPATSFTPLLVVGLTGATSISAGTGSDNGYTCALLADGTVRCWGYYIDAATFITFRSGTPVAVAGLTGATAVSVRGDHACALLMSGMLQCWGVNMYGQLGNNSMTGSLTPVSVVGLSGATAVAAGIGYTCAVLAGGTVQCWGYNGQSQLGNGSTMNSLTPVPVAGSGIGGVTSISAGQTQACGLLTNGTVQCWGG